MTSLAQLQLPGYCWHCLGRGVVQVAATAITPDGDRYCVQELVPCPDCRRPEPGTDGSWR